MTGRFQVQSQFLIRSLRSQLKWAHGVKNNDRPEDTQPEQAHAEDEHGDFGEDGEEEINDDPDHVCEDDQADNLEESMGDNNAEDGIDDLETDGESSNTEPEHERTNTSADVPSEWMTCWHTEHKNSVQDQRRHSR